MTYSPLPIEIVNLEDLQLDLENYRIPTKQTSEANALKYMFSEEDVMGSVLEILRDGYFDNEVPVVTKVGQKFVVLEGNRRVSALKSLADPSIIPSHESEIRRLLKRYAVEAQSLPRAIRAMVSPNREQVTSRIVRLHTGLPKKGWSPDQQANFYYSLLDSTTTVADVKAEFPGEKVTRLMKMAAMRRFVSHVPFSDHTLREYASSDLKMSVLEYAFSRMEIALLFGVKFSLDGLIEPVDKTPEELGAKLAGTELAALEYLVSKFRTNELNTRSPEFKKREYAQTRVLLDKMVLAGRVGALHADEQYRVAKEEKKREAHAPGHDYGDFPSPANPVENSAEGSDDRPKEPRLSSEEKNLRSGTTKRGPNHPETKNKLVLEGIPYETAPVTLQKRYFELRKINIVDLPVAATMLMRSVLESTIKYSFEGTPTRARGELSAVFKMVEEHFGQDKSVKSPISRIKSGNAQAPGSVQWFNVIMHSADEDVSDKEVRQAWALVNPILRLLLNTAKNRPVEA